MLSICKPRVLRAAGPCCSSSAGARRPRCCAVPPAAAGDRSGCYRPRSSSIARAGAAAAGRVGSLRLACCVARAVGPKDEEPAAPEAQAAARAAQQQQAARAQSFYAAAARVFPLHALRAVPPKPPPLSALPDEPLPADSIPPLLEWVTTARMRPVAVQSILEQHCSPGVRRIVAAAARLLAEAEQEEQSQEDKGGGGGILITSAHLALAALAEHDGDVDCAAALGVLHHSAAGLSLQRCAEVLAWRAAQEQRWEEETRRYEDSGSSSSGKGNSSGSSIFSAPALHFVFQSYRWAVFTGCDTVQPCHLLWALAADPRLSYSPLRTDPLDGRVAAAEVREPPLVWLLQQFPKELPRPAAVYEQLLGVVQLGLQRQQAVAASAAATATAFACGGSTTGAGGKFAGAYGGLITQLDGLAGWPSTERSLDDLAALLRACRLAGHVPSRQQLQAADRLLARCVMQPRGTFVPSFWHGRWPAVVELAEAFAALGWKMVAVDEFDVNRGREHSRLQPAAAVVAAAAAATDVFDRVQALCRAGAAMRFCFATELLRGTRIPDELWRESMAMATAAPASAPLRARALQALLAVTDLPADVPWLPTLAAELANAAAAHADPEDMAALKTVRETPLCYVSGDTARIAVCVALQTADTGLAARWRAGGLQRQDGVDVDVDMEAVAAVAASLRCGMPLPARVQLLHALNEIRKHGNMPSFVVWLHAVLASSIDLDSSSIHASLRTQRRVAAAYAVAGCGVPEGWLRQLVSYGDEMRGGSSKGAAEALQVVLRAAASGSGAPALASCGGGNANTSSTSSGTATSQMKVLCQLAKLLERNAAAGWLSPHATQAVLGHLQALAEAAAGRDGINSLAASCGPATAILALAATRPGTPAALDPELLSALSDMTGSELPCMVGGEQQHQLAALMNGHTHKQHY